jgi:LAO/AO transport system kinase
VTGAGLDEAWAEMQTLAGWRKDIGWWDRTRADQATRWFEEEVRDGLLRRLSRPEIRALMSSRAEAVARGEISPEAAAQEVLARVTG